MTRVVLGLAHLTAVEFAAVPALRDAGTDRRGL